MSLLYVSVLDAAALKIFICYKYDCIATKAEGHCTRDPIDFRQHNPLPCDYRGFGITGCFVSDFLLDMILKIYNIIHRMLGSCILFDHQLYRIMRPFLSTTFIYFQPPSPIIIFL